MSEAPVPNAAPTHAKQSLRVWLRMLGATTVIEKTVRAYLKARFDSTLPRFDVLAMLDREAAPVTLSALSAKLLVSNGNVTGLVARLVAPRSCRTQRGPPCPARAAKGRTGAKEGWTSRIRKGKQAGRRQTDTLTPARKALLV